MLLKEENRQTFAQVVQRKCIPREGLAIFVDNMRQEGKTLVTINGSFDLLHPGHLEMLYQASMQGDILLVLLNSDRSIKKYKSSKRPINSLRDRLQNMAAIEFVDYVSSFDETDPIEALKVIKPSVHVNGSEYGENCIEADIVRQNGGRIHLVELVGGYSSTSLIRRIREMDL